MVTVKDRNCFLHNIVPNSTNVHRLSLSYAPPYRPTPFFFSFSFFFFFFFETNRWKRENGKRNGHQDLLFPICSVDFVQNVVSFVSDVSGTGYTQHGQVSQLA